MKRPDPTINPALLGLFKTNLTFHSSKFVRAMLEDNSRAELFDSPSPTVLKVADKPPALGGKIEEIPTTTFCQKEDIVWTESCIGPAALKPHIVEESKTKEPHEDEAKISDRLQHPFDLIICSIDPSVGKGVFLSPASPPIEEGQIVILYAGCLSDSGKRLSDPDFNPYEIKSHESDLFQAENNPDFPKHGWISGLTHRNMASYIQDGPTQREKDEMIFHNSVKDKVAMANLKMKTATFKGCPVTYLVATDHIEPGAQLLYPYSTKTFWPAAKKALGIERRFFTKEGGLIDQKLHDKRIVHHELPDGAELHLTNYMIKAYILANTPLTSPIKISVPELVDFLGYDPRKTQKEVSMTLGEHTTITLSMTLDEEARKAYKSENNPLLEFLAVLSNKVKGAKSATEAFQLVTEALSAKNKDYVKMHADLEPIKEFVKRIILNHNRENKKEREKRDLKKIQEAVDEYKY